MITSLSFSLFFLFSFSSPPPVDGEQKRKWAINILLLCFPLCLSGLLKLIDTVITEAINSMTDFPRET